MGTEYSPGAGIGILLDLSVLEKPGEPVPSCEHAVRRGRTFCPDCGKRVTKDRITVDYQDRWAVDAQLQEMQTHEGILLTYADFHGGVWFLGWGQSFDRDAMEGPFPLPNLEELDAQIEAVVQSIKGLDVPDVIVRPHSFGFHVFMPGH